MKLVAVIFFTICLSLFSQTSKKSKVDYEGFAKKTLELKSFRDSRLISADEFNTMSAEAGTIILDTRSKSAFDRIHVVGAVHLNFSDFTKQKLAEVIPSKETRILIYCNNNFESEDWALMLKSPPLALNIPTFINLHGYGYENIYELEDYIKEEDSKIKLEKQ